MKRLSFLLTTMLLTSTAIQATAADSTSFNPNTMASVTAQVETPVGTIMPWAVDTAPPTMAGEVIWLPCDGQAIPSGAEYDELRTTLNSSTLPNLNNNQFLKGSTTQIGKQVAQSTVNTTVNIPDHKHDLTGGVAGGQTIVSGGAGGQGFSYQGPSSGGNRVWIEVNTNYKGGVITLVRSDNTVWESWNMVSSSDATRCYAPLSGDYNRGYFSCGTRPGYADKSEFTRISGGSTTAYGSTSGGSIYGTTSASGLSGTTGAAGATTMTIKDTTAPAHTKVMYYIKARD